MRLACNAPADLWDEFSATSAYLTNFTASSSINGRTPYELWFGEKPSLSHLREIACRAFALIQTNNPKLFQRSVPCILIGYAPRAKAYRLWNTTTGKVFNSYHVTFVEYLQSQPASLLPGTIIVFNPDAPPTLTPLTPGIAQATSRQRPSNPLLPTTNQQIATTCSRPPCPSDNHTSPRPQPRPTSTSHVPARPTTCPPCFRPNEQQHNNEQQQQRKYDTYDRTSQ